jgi:undecaprenyl-diphosphatase
MLEFLETIDKAVFIFVNVRLANPVTDFIMPLITADFNLRLLYGIAMVILLLKGDARLRWLVLISVVTLVLTDRFTAGFLKNFFMRPRPCHILSEINLLVACGSGYAMPSTHAANAFGQAALFGSQYHKARPYLYSFASLVAVSRVFVGVHYPLDIIVGGVIGGLAGWAAAAGFKRLEIGHDEG